MKHTSSNYTNNIHKNQKNQQKKYIKKINNN